MHAYMLVYMYIYVCMFSGLARGSSKYINKYIDESGFIFKNMSDYIDIYTYIFFFRFGHTHEYICIYTFICTINVDIENSSERQKAEKITIKIKNFFELNNQELNSEYNLIGMVIGEGLQCNVIGI